VLRHLRGLRDRSKPGDCRVMSVPRQYDFSFTETYGRSAENFMTRSQVIHWQTAAAFGFQHLSLCFLIPFRGHVFAARRGFIGPFRVLLTEVTLSFQVWSLYATVYVCLYVFRHINVSVDRANRLLRTASRFPSFV
jgi:hypothetical protein